MFSKKIIFLLSSMIIGSLNLQASKITILSSSFKPRRLTHATTGGAVALALIYSVQQLMEYKGDDHFSSQRVLSNVKAISQLITAAALVGFIPSYGVDLYLHNKHVNKALKPHSHLLYSGTFFGFLTGLGYTVHKVFKGKNVNDRMLLRWLLIASMIGAVFGYTGSVITNISTFSQHTYYQRCIETYTALYSHPFFTWLENQAEGVSDWSLKDQSAFWNLPQQQKVITDYVKESGLSLSSLITYLSELLENLMELKKEIITCNCSEKMSEEEWSEIKALEKWLLFIEFHFSEFIFQISSLSSSALHLKLQNA